MTRQERGILYFIFMTMTTLVYLFLGFEATILALLVTILTTIIIFEDIKEVNKDE